MDAIATRALACVLATTVSGCAAMSFPEPESAAASAAASDASTGAAPVSEHSAEAVANRHPKSWSELSRDGRDAVRMRDYERAEQRYIAALEVSNAFPPGDVRVRTTLGNLVRVADAYQATARFEDAQRVLDSIVASGAAGRSAAFAVAAPPFTVQATHQLDAGSTEAAVRNLEATLALDGAESAGNAPARLEIEQKLGVAYGRAGRYDDAKILLESVITMLREWEGDDSPATGAAWLSLARVASEQGDEALAESAYLEAIRIQERADSLSIELAVTTNELAWFYLQHGRNAESALLASSAVAILDAAKVSGLPLTAALDTQATAEARLGRTADAETHYQRALDARDLAPPEERRRLDDVVHRYAELLRASGRPDEAAAAEKRLEPATPQ